MTAPASPAELLTRDLQNLDSGFGELRVGGFVALVCDDDSRSERDNVVSVVPLGPFGLELVARGRHGPKLLDAESVAYLVQERTVRDLGGDAAVSVGPIQDRQDLIDDRLVDRDDVLIAEREHRV